MNLQNKENIYSFSKAEHILCG